LRKQEEQKFDLGEEGGEVTYIFTQMKPEDATRVALRLMKIAGLQVGGALGSLQLKPGGVQNSDFDMDMELLGQSIGKMFQQIDEDETIDTIKKLLGTVLCNGKPMTINHLNFQGRTLHLMNVVQTAGRVNFSDFFDASSGVLGKVKAVIESTLKKATSTGPTGDSSSAA